MQKKQVIVVGAGIAGLTAGIYAQKCGFEVTLLERHHSAGGMCTSWKRGDYLFEGGMHWLSGSNKNVATNKMWRHIGALDDAVEVDYDEPFLEYDHMGIPIRLYRDVDVTERDLLALSPVDGKEVKKFCNDIRKLKNITDTITDLRGVRVTKKNRSSLSALFAFLPIISVMSNYAKISREQYVNRFAHEGIREMFRSIPSEKQGMPMLFLTLSSLARGDGGFPKGGSLPFVERIINKYTSLGGKILYKTHVNRIVTKNDKAVGIIAGERRFDGDAVIVTVDTMAMDYLFETPPKAPWLDKMYKVTKPTMVTFVFLGINVDLTRYPKYYIFKLKKAICLSDQTYKYLSVNNYAADRAYAPEGKTVMTIQLPGDTYDFWEKIKRDNDYTEEKRRIVKEVIAAITAQMPEVAGQIEVGDVATPLSYERYCANWKGSWMTEVTPDMNFKPYPAVIKGLGHIYFAGHRMMPPGGLLSALMSGRTAVQHLCRDTETLFISEE